MSTVLPPRPASRPAGPRRMHQPAASAPVAASPALRGRPPRARATQDVTAWALVFDRLEANPYQLASLRQVCHTFDALAGNNLRWLPYTPLVELGLGPPYYPLPEGCELHRDDFGNWWTRGFEAHPHFFSRAEDGLAYVQQHLATAAGTQVSPFELPKLPTWLGAPEVAGWLRTSFQRRMVAAAQLGPCLGGMRVPQLMAKMWQGAPEVPTQAEWPMFDDTEPALRQRIRQALALLPGHFDLLRAAVDRPDLCEAPGLGTYALQAEPAIFATWLTRHGTYGGVRAPAVTRDLAAFFRLAVTDSQALLSVHRDLASRLDVCVWGLAHGRHQASLCATYFAPKVPDADVPDGSGAWPAPVPVDFAAHRARVAVDSPIYRLPGGAELMEEVVDWPTLESVAGRLCAPGYDTLRYMDDIWRFWAAREPGA